MSARMVEEIVLSTSIMIVLILMPIVLNLMMLLEHLIPIMLRQIHFTLVVECLFMVHWRLLEM